MNKFEKAFPKNENMIDIIIKTISIWYSFSSGLTIDIDEYMFVGKNNIAIIPAQSPDSNVDIVSLFKSAV